MPRLRAALVALVTFGAVILVGAAPAQAATPGHPCALNISLLGFPLPVNGAVNPDGLSCGLDFGELTAIITALNEVSGGAGDALLQALVIAGTACGSGGSVPPLLTYTVSCPT